MGRWGVGVVPEESGVRHDLGRSSLSQVPIGPFPDGKEYPLRGGTFPFKAH